MAWIKKFMKKIFYLVFVLVILFAGLSSVTLAAETEVNLTLRNSATIIFSQAIPLQPAGTIEIDGHTVDANSVLAVLNDADILSPDFNISDLQYYDSFGSFYVKCIESSIGNDCDNWQYVIDDNYPTESVDQKILSGGENIYFYFGPQNRIILSDGEITTKETLTVKTKKYDYKNNDWVVRNGITIGITQTNPDDPWSPIEIKTSPVNENGQTIFSEIPRGKYNVGIQEDFYFPTEPLEVKNPPATGGHGSNGESTTTEKQIKPTFNLTKAFDFLVSQQKENGSFGENLYTDWAALALASGNYQDQTIKLIRYFSESKMENLLLTDYERHAMALMSLGLNPYNINGENYIEKITSQFDGKQFGNPNENNDDIFALIVLQNAGYGQDEKIIADDIIFILSKQKENGSWDESVDMTGAGIVALSAFGEDKKVNNALAKAEKFLKQNQQKDGSWGNVSSTAWALGGVIALGEKIKDSTKEYLGGNQDEDGGIKGEDPNSRVWQTAYVLTSLSSKTWNQIMQKFEKPKITPEKLKTAVVTKIPPKISGAQSLKTNALTTTNSTSILPIIEKPENPKKNWFIKFWDKIFSIF